MYSPIIRVGPDDCRDRYPAEFKTFKSTNHVVKTVTIKKIGLSPYDTKRYILPDGISTLCTDITKSLDDILKVIVVNKDD